MAFIVLRDGTGYLQCVLNGDMVILSLYFYSLFAVPFVWCLDLDSRIDCDHLWCCRRSPWRKKCSWWPRTASWLLGSYWKSSWWGWGHYQQSQRCTFLLYVAFLLLTPTRKPLLIFSWIRDTSSFVVKLHPMFWRCALLSWRLSVITLIPSLSLKLHLLWWCKLKSKVEARSSLLNIMVKPYAISLIRSRRLIIAGLLDPIVAALFGNLFGFFGWRLLYGWLVPCRKVAH